MLTAEQVAKLEGLTVIAELREASEPLWRRYWAAVDAMRRKAAEAAAAEAEAEAAAAARVSADPRVQSAARVGGYSGARQIARKLILEDDEYQRHLDGIRARYVAVRDELAASALDLVKRMAAVA